MRTVARSPLATMILAMALALSACQSQAPPPTSSDHELSPLVKGAYPCPYGMLANIRMGFVNPVSELNAAEFGGPAGFPKLTEGYPASCAFRYEASPDGPAVIQAYFVGMGPEFVLEMAKRLKKYGFTLVESNNDLPRDWSLDGLQVDVIPRQANDIGIQNITFDRDFVIVSVPG
jgi:hypothetical protein